MARTKSPRPPATAEASVAPSEPPTDDLAGASEVEAPPDGVIRVRRIHRRDLNRVWEFLKRVFRLVNRETVEYQRPRTKVRFLEIYEEEGIEQLLFEIREGNGHVIVGYAECAYEVLGSDSWINERYFSNRDMRPLFVEEIAIHPGYQGRGIGSFVIEQLEHLARLRGCTHLVLEVAQNNNKALSFYRARSFYQLDAAIFLAKKVSSEPELLPPRALRPTTPDSAQPVPTDSSSRKRRKGAKPATEQRPAPSASGKRGAKAVAADTADTPRAKERRGAKTVAEDMTDEPSAPGKRGAKAMTKDPADEPSAPGKRGAKAVPKDSADERRAPGKRGAKAMAKDPADERRAPGKRGAKAVPKDSADEPRASGKRGGASHVPGGGRAGSGRGVKVVREASTEVRSRTPGPPRGAAPPVPRDSPTEARPASTAQPSRERVRLARAVTPPQAAPVRPGRGRKPPVN